MMSDGHRAGDAQFGVPFIQGQLHFRPGEPPNVSHLHDIEVDVFGSGDPVAADHELRRERPGLGTVIVNGTNVDARLLLHLAAHSLFQGLSLVEESGQRRVEIAAGHTALGLAKEAAITCWFIDNQHDCHGIGTGKCVFPTSAAASDLSATLRCGCRPAFSAKWVSPVPVELRTGLCEDSRLFLIKLSGQHATVDVRLRLRWFTDSDRKERVVVLQAEEDHLIVEFSRDLIEGFPGELSVSGDLDIQVMEGEEPRIFR